MADKPPGPCAKEQRVVTMSIPETQRGGHGGGMCDLRVCRVVLITEARRGRYSGLGNCAWVILVLMGVLALAFDDLSHPICSVRLTDGFQNEK